MPANWLATGGLSMCVLLLLLLVVVHGWHQAATAAAKQESKANPHVADSFGSKIGLHLSRKQFHSQSGTTIPR
jgi:hypothetical protein